MLHILPFKKAKKKAFSGQVLCIGPHPGFVPQLLLRGNMHILRPPER
jgi:hypothetical protein